MRKLTVTLAAEADINSIAEFIANREGSRTAADEFIDSLLEHCERLAGLPGTLGTPRPELRSGLRSAPHRGYVIFFRYAEATVEIVNILNGRMDAGEFYDVGRPQPDEPKSDG